MANSKWIYRKSDGVFLQGGFYAVELPTVGDPPVPDTGTYGIAEFGDADQPDPARHRFDAATGKRLMTQAELTAVADARLAEQATLTSREKDILAMIALIEKRTNPSWPTLTAAQRKSAVLAAADEWKSLRVLVDKFV